MEELPSWLALLIAHSSPTAPPESPTLGLAYQCTGSLTSCRWFAGLLQVGAVLVVAVVVLVLCNCVRRRPQPPERHARKLDTDEDVEKVVKSEEHVEPSPPPSESSSPLRAAAHGLLKRAASFDRKQARALLVRAASFGRSEQTPSTVELSELV
jgi:hypothetical protein